MKVQIEVQQPVLVMRDTTEHPEDFFSCCYTII